MSYLTETCIAETLAWSWGPDCDTVALKERVYGLPYLKSDEARKRVYEKTLKVIEQEKARVQESHESL